MKQASSLVWQAKSNPKTGSAPKNVSWWYMLLKTITSQESVPLSWSKSSPKTYPTDSNRQANSRIVLPARLLIGDSSLTTQLSLDNSRRCHSITRRETYPYTSPTRKSSVGTEKGHRSVNITNEKVPIHIGRAQWKNTSQSPRKGLQLGRVDVKAGPRTDNLLLESSEMTSQPWPSSITWT